MNIKGLDTEETCISVPACVFLMSVFPQCNLV